MEIINSIAHKIIKHRREKDKPNLEAEVQLRDDIFDPANEKVITLIEALLKIYKGKTFGSFEADTNNHPFQLWAKDLYKENSLTINSLPQKFIDELIELTKPTTNTNG
ncbi:nucleoid-associated protein [Methylocucumis oryzae]|uniref:Uncharacterized protein n=1 Tax=Methylocucumis oryzae TaxID=1632867 RepID=A0A0F3IMU5_9GAMM|nr:hypothetical protein [Methylocucumis oryzae]KJV08041.1 hypothetical protein VZ94_00640 [Methylocucumis oryzae]